MHILKTVNIINSGALFNVNAHKRDQMHVF